MWVKECLLWKASFELVLSSFKKLCKFPSLDVDCNELNDGVRYVGVMSVLINLCIITMASATVIVRAGGCFSIKHVAIVLYVV